MTTFAEMRTLTLDVTKRPELVSQTDAAIRMATLRAHHVDFFPRDKVEQSIPYVRSPTAMFYDFPNISAQCPRLRIIKEVYTLTAEGFKTEELEYRDTDDNYDSDGRPRRFIYNLIGDTLRCFFDLPSGIAQVYYYRNPDVQEATYSSWIADMYPDQLAHWAAAIVLRRSGFEAIADRLLQQEIQPFKEQLISSHLLGGA